jgi:hypothetical protein
LCHWLGIDAATCFAVLNSGNERRLERFRTRFIDDCVRYLSDREDETLLQKFASLRKTIAEKKYQVSVADSGWKIIGHMLQL